MSMKSRSDSQLWEQLVSSYMTFVETSTEFLSGDVDRVSLMRNALRGKDRMAALYLAPKLSEADKMVLLDEWVFLASFDHGALWMVREIILSLPRKWVLANIEKAVAPMLNNGDSLEYRRVLELYALLDRNFALGLAQRAASHDDFEIKEAGTDFIEKLSE